MKQSDNWQTPDWLMNHFNGHYDPCPTDPKFNGLDTDWSYYTLPVYVNPPYSNPLPWIRKAILKSKKGVDVVMLL